MSVINQVLKDLDRQGANVVAPNGVIAVNRRDAAAPRRLGVLAAFAALAAAAWWLWPVGADPNSDTATPAAPPMAESAPVSVERVPKLRLSEQLSALSPQADSASGQRPAVADLVVPDRAPPNAVVPQPRLDIRLPGPAVVELSESEAPKDGTPKAETGKAETRKVDARKVDARKVEAPKAESAPPQVLKEIKPPTAQVQAEEAWRQASRLLEQGRNHDALERLESALRLDPAHVGARQSLVALLLGAGASAESAARAELLLREGWVLHLNDPWYPRSLAQLQLQRGDAAQAAATLKAGLDQRVDAGNWGLYASTLAKLGKPAEAVQAYREALRLNPDQGNWWIGFAVALEQIGAKTDAGAAYQRALQARLSNALRDFAQQKARELGAR